MGKVARTKIVLGHAMGEPGVYLLAHFETVAPGAANPRDPRIVYIGETHDDNFNNRLNAFHRCAFQGKEGHAGGITYHDKFPNATGENLYLAIYPPKMMISPKLHSTYIMHLEAALRWEFAVENKRLPACNKE
jgi:hypothetical protein